jgi:hypothetical protein
MKYLVLFDMTFRHGMSSRSFTKTMPVVPLVDDIVIFPDVTVKITLRILHIDRAKLKVTIPENCDQDTVFELRCEECW